MRGFIRKEVADYFNMWGTDAHNIFRSCRSRYGVSNEAISLALEYAFKNRWSPSPLLKDLHYKIFMLAQNIDSEMKSESVIWNWLRFVARKHPRIRFIYQPVRRRQMRLLGWIFIGSLTLFLLQAMARTLI